MGVVGASSAWESDFDTGVRLAWNADRGIQTSIYNVAGGLQPPQPSGVDDAAGRGLEQLYDLTAHAFGDLQRGDGEVQLIHAAADELHEKPEKEVPSERDFRPDLQVVLSGVLVEMTDFASNGVRIEGMGREGASASL